MVFESGRFNFNDLTEVHTTYTLILAILRCRTRLEIGVTDQSFRATSRSPVALHRSCPLIQRILPRRPGRYRFSLSNIPPPGEYTISRRTDTRLQEEIRGK